MPTMPTLQVCLGPCGFLSMAKACARCGVIFKTRAGSGQQTKEVMEIAAVSLPAQAKQLISPLLIPTIFLGLTSPSLWLHRRAFSSSLKTAVTSPRNTGLTLSSPLPPARLHPLEPCSWRSWDAEQKPQGHSPRQT